MYQHKTSIWRIPKAAHRLLHDVQIVAPDATMHPWGEIDGYGVYRSVVFDPTTSTWLPDCLDAIGDRRIIHHARIDEGLVVTFTATFLADHRNSFPIRAVKRILDT